MSSATEDNLVITGGLCGDDALNSDDYSPKITQAPQWPEINTLCEQINMTAQIIKDAPGILISVK